jgi:hypothetical protein
MMAMNDKTPASGSNVLPFQPDGRRKDQGADVTGDWIDNGPSPDESLRMIRAFLGIKNRQSRQNFLELLEGVSRTPGQAAGPLNK